MDRHLLGNGAAINSYADDDITALISATGGKLTRRSIYPSSKDPSALNKPASIEIFLPRVAGNGRSYLYAAALLAFHSSGLEA